MSQLAVGYRDGANGRQQRSDGLIKHLGTVDAGSLRATDNQTSTIKLGAGLELLFDRPSQTGYIVAFDREKQVYLDLAINCRNLAMFPQSGGTFQLPANAIDGGAIKTDTITAQQLAPGAAQALVASYNTTTTWSAAGNGAYQETAVQASASFTGAQCRIEYSLSAYVSVVGQYCYVALGMDGTAIIPMAFFNAPAVNYAIPCSGVWYTAVSAGAHRFSVFVLAAAGTTVGLYQYVNSTLWVTEQRA